MYFLILRHEGSSVGQLSAAVYSSKDFGTKGFKRKACAIDEWHKKLQACVDEK